MKKYLFFLVFTIVVQFVLKAQSVNFIHPQPLWNEHSPLIEMNLIPLTKLQLEDELNKNNKTIPWRFAFEFNTNFTPENAGAWQFLDDGTKIWQLKISSPNAQTLHFVLENFNLPKDAYIIIYNNKNQTSIKAYNSSNINAEHILGTTLIVGDEAVIEYAEPANAEFRGTFSVSKVFHGYRTFGYKSILTGFGSSGNCENNVNCPIGNDWQKEKRAVVVLVAGASFCSGSLLNNPLQDTTPFLITAHHCGTTGTASWVFVFNYESPNCTNINVAQNQTVSGATLLATNTKSDFSLLKLNSKVPLSYHPFFEGWDNSNTIPDTVVCIHHPEGDIKKISIANNACYDSSYTDGYTAKCWNIKHWDNGVTEPGSSGSPLFNKHHQFVGQLFGGPSYCGCDDTDKNDYFGKFSTSWDADTAFHAQAKYWLDPQNTGAISILGFDPNPPKNIGIEDVIKSDFQVYPNPVGQSLLIRHQSFVKSIEVIDIIGQIINCKLQDTNSSTTIIDVSNLSSGIYFLKIVDEKNNFTVKKFVKE